VGIVECFVRLPEAPSEASEAESELDDSLERAQVGWIFGLLCAA
jgi:hypothetical protein